jgi:hypothetical protein
MRARRLSEDHGKDATNHRKVSQFNQVKRPTVEHDQHFLPNTHAGWIHHSKLFTTQDPAGASGSKKCICVSCVVFWSERLVDFKILQIKSLICF